MNVGKRIDYMHDTYGVVGNRICEDCKHLKEIKGFYKCEIYGIDGTNKTNWKNNLIACGKFKK